MALTKPIQLLLNTVNVCPALSLGLSVEVAPKARAQVLLNSFRGHIFTLLNRFDRIFQTLLRERYFLFTIILIKTNVWGQERTLRANTHHNLTLLLSLNTGRSGGPVNSAVHHKYIYQSVCALV